MAGNGEIRAKEARVTLRVDGVALGGSFSTIHDIDVKPDAEITKKQFTGDQRARGDIIIRGYDISFKSEKRDHLWSQLWRLIEECESSGRPLPDIVMTLTYGYRDGSGLLHNETLSGDMVLKMDSNSIPKDGYQMNQWTGFCSHNTASQA